MGSREAIVAAVVCVAGACVLFAEPLFGGKSTLSFDSRHPAYPAPWHEPTGLDVPINPVTSDIDFFVLPGLMRQRQLEATGGGPWWDKAGLLGYPLGANMPFPTFLPTARPLAAVDPVTTLDLLTAFYAALAAWLAYRAARLLGASPPAAAVAAVGFALSSWMTTRWHLPQIGWTTAVFPGFLAVVARLARGARLGAAAELAVWVFLSLCSGFPQLALVFLGATAVLALTEPAVRRPAPLLCLGLGVALGVGMAAPQIAALRSVYPESARATEASRELAAQHGLLPGAVLGGVLPELFGVPPRFAVAGQLTRSEDYLPRRLLLSADVQDNVVENALYPGLALLLLGAAALSRQAGRRARVLIALALGSVLAAIVFPWAVRAVPALAVFAGAAIKRLLVLVACCVPLAGALAFDSVRARRQALPWRAAVGVLLVLGGLFVWSRIVNDPAAASWRAEVLPQLGLQFGLLIVAWGCFVACRRRLPGAAWLVALILAVDLGARAWAFNPFPPQVEPFPATASTEWLAQRPGRIVTYGSQRVLPATLAALHGIDSLGGIAPLLDERVNELLACIEGPLSDRRDPRVVFPLRQEQSLDHPLLDLLAVATIVHADVELASRVPQAWRDEAEGLAAIDRPTAGPLAYLAHGVEVVPDAATRLERLSRRDFDGHATVLLEIDPGLDLKTRGAWQPVELSSPRAGQYELVVEASRAGIVVIVASWHAGWQLQVDGQAQPLLRAHHALMAVPLSAGRHEIDLTYQVPGSDTAAVQANLAGMAWLAVLLASLIAAARRKGIQSPETAL